MSVAFRTFLSVLAQVNRKVRAELLPCFIAHLRQPFFDVCCGTVVPRGFSLASFVIDALSAMA
jgi:hypothetical protein